MHEGIGRVRVTRRALLLVAPVLLALVLAGCAASQPAPAVGPGMPGFWLGLWQGIIAPITFVVSLFVDGVRIYAYPNVGRWYDFGFMLGIGGFTGGIFAGSRRRRR
jgi:hypothetical protein